MTLGIALALWTVRLAMLCYVISIVEQLRRGPAGLAAGRLTWTLGCVLLWIHVALSMHFIFAWDHARMVRHTVDETAGRTGIAFGGGAYVNYLLMVVWAADAAWWWLAGPKRRRPVWWTASIHAFFAFIVFNAVVVFTHTAWVRWCGVAACIIIAGVAWMNRRSRSLVTTGEAGSP